MKIVVSQKLKILPVLTNCFLSNVVGKDLLFLKCEQTNPFNLPV